MSVVGSAGNKVSSKALKDNKEQVRVMALTHISPVLQFILKPVLYFDLEIKWWFLYEMQHWAGID